MSASAQPLPGNTSFIQNMLQLRQHGFLGYLGQMWQQHGDLYQIKMGPKNMVVAIHPDSVRHVTITHRQNYDKLESYEPARRYLLGNGLLTAIGEKWRTQRKTLAPFYTPRAVQAYADIMLLDGQRLGKQWEGLATRGTTIAMDEEMATITASIILKTMFSIEANDQIIGIKNAVETMIAYSSLRQSMPVPIPVWLPIPANRRYLAARDLVNRYIDSVIAYRRGIPEAEWPLDLLTKLMQTRNEETGELMSESLLRDEAITTFFAGHETSARLMTFTWYALAANPQVADRLHEELDTVLGTEAVTLEALHHLPYTMQVLKEALRLYPPAPYYVRDAIEDDTMNGFAIPAKAAIMLSPYYTHRHPEFWTDPLRFDPDRWTPEREAQLHPSAYHPFSSGQRICIGNNFSLLETHILLATLAQRFTPRLVPGYEPQWMSAGTLGLANGLPMTLEKR